MKQSMQINSTNTMTTRQLKTFGLHRLFHLLTYLLLLSNFSSCTSVPQETVKYYSTPVSQQTNQNKQAFFHQEAAYSDFELGLSLSGGGMRSASFSIGVLSGLADANVLQQIDYLSSVSGGGYAGYWLMSALLTNTKERLGLTYDALFNDCYPNNFCLFKDTTNYLYQETCSEFNSRNSDKFRFQTQVAQQSDLLFYYQDSGNTQWANFKAKTIRLTEGMAIVGLQLLSLPLHHLGNTLFDWNWHVSPARFAYRTGIERTFGLMPSNLLHHRIDDKAYYNEQSFGWMDNYQTQAITFNQLKDSIHNNHLVCTKLQSQAGQCLRLPIWIINASSAAHRNLCSIFDSSGKNADNIFEFTPFSYGSNQNGYVAKPFAQTSIQEIVQISGAALDSQFSKLSSPTSTTLLHALNLNLGGAIDNYHPQRLNLAYHKILPFPFYCLQAAHSPAESPSIYLSDGGHSENTGAYSLITRGVKNIVMVDATYDPQGKWMELKNLASLLAKHHGLHLSVGTIPLLDANLIPLDKTVEDPAHSSENLFLATVQGFAPGYISHSSTDPNFIRIVYVKLGIVPDLMTSNCAHSPAYPCSVSRFYLCGRSESMNNICSHNDLTDFPFHSTEKTSANMTQNIYFAYRDLGKYIARRIYYKDGQINFYPMPEERQSLTQY